MSRRNRFVSTETVRLDLSDGDWVEVKERLSYSEAQALAGANIIGQRRTGEFELDLARFNIKRIETWLTDWSFTNDDGKSVDLTPAAIRNLDPDTAVEILAAFDAYEIARDADPNDKVIAETPSKAK